MAKGGERKAVRSTKGQWGKCQFEVQKKNLSLNSDSKCSFWGQVQNPFFPSYKENGNGGVHGRGGKLDHLIKLLTVHSFDSQVKKPGITLVFEGSKLGFKSCIYLWCIDDIGSIWNIHNFCKQIRNHQLRWRGLVKAETRLYMSYLFPGSRVTRSPAMYNGATLTICHPAEVDCCSFQARRLRHYSRPFPFFLFLESDAISRFMRDRDRRPFLHDYANLAY